VEKRDWTGDSSVGPLNKVRCNSSLNLALLRKYAVELKLQSGGKVSF